MDGEMKSRSPQANEMVWGSRKQAVGSFISALAKIIWDVEAFFIHPLLISAFFLSADDVSYSLYL
jgi:hypothetical protein